MYHNGSVAFGGLRDAFSTVKKDFHFCNGLESNNATIIQSLHGTQRDIFAAVDSYSLRLYINGKCIQSQNRI